MGDRSIDTERFYQAIPPCPSFAEAVDERWYHRVPDDWIIIATDVENSTEAIEAGRYKDVTVAGAVGTIAIANITGSLDFPFFFGGDGMFFLLPGSYRAPVLDVLADVRRVIAEISALSLRAGLVPVAEIRADGADLRIGKVRVTDKYDQAVAIGSAFAVVDDILKGRRTGPIERPSDTPKPGGLQADFRGFSCRWADIPSHRGETISLIVEAVDGADSEAYRRVHAVLEEIVGGDGGHPLSVRMQKTTAAAATAGTEARYRARKRSGVAVFIHNLRVMIEVAYVRLAVWTGIPLRGEGKRLNRVREDNIENADVRKIDGTLKMTIALTPSERATLLQRLDELYRDGRIFYGVNVSDRAVMTCLIHTNHEDEVHFVDSAGGGYARAAAMLKKQMRAAAES